VWQQLWELTAAQNAPLTFMHVAAMSNLKGLKLLVALCLYALCRNGRQKAQPWTLCLMNRTLDAPFQGCTDLFKPAQISACLETHWEVPNVFGHGNKGDAVQQWHLTVKFIFLASKGSNSDYGVIS